MTTQNAIELAKMMVDGANRDIDACTNYVMMPMLKQMLAKAQEELAYAIATNTPE